MESGMTLILLIVVYFVPSIYAHHINHANRSAITALNMLLGWTFIGWVIALIWTLKKS